MKVVHVSWSLAFGGIETMLVNIANAQVKEGAEVSIIIINDIYDESLLKSLCDEVNVVFLHRKLHSYDLGFVFRFNRALHRINPDVIHLHISRMNELIFSHRLRHRVVRTFHDLPSGQLRRKGIIYRIFPILGASRDKGNVMFIDKIPKVFAISEAVKKALCQNYGIVSTVICNGIRTADFSIRTRSSCSLPLRIVQVSRLHHEKKGQDILIRAIAQLKGEVEIFFIGEGPSIDYLTNLAIELGVDSCVHFLGMQTQKEIARSLCEYDLFVQPSRYEGFGLTVAEAMAAQLPVLVSSGQGPAEVTCGNKFGWIFENGNADDLVRMIMHIRMHYNEAFDKSLAARCHVINTYDVAVTANKYLMEYMK